MSHPFAPATETVATNHMTGCQPVSGRAWLAVAALALLTACGEQAANKPAADAASARSSAAAKADPNVVEVSPEIVNRFRVSKVMPTELLPTQTVAGRIEANEKRLTRIGAAVTGRVTNLLVEVGDQVKRGQALAHVSSPELTSAQLSYLRASATAQLAERSVERARQLLEADVIGSAELQRRQSELSIARAEQRAYADQLQLLGVADAGVKRLGKQGALNQHAAVTASLAGTVVERNVSHGQVVQPGDPLFTVADLSSVWVVGALPEQAASTVHVGQAVEVDVPALGPQPLSGRIVVVGDTVNPETRTVSIRTEVQNTNRALKPQMLATMRLTGTAVRRLAVPDAAVVRENDRDHVFVQVAPLVFRLTPVQLGAPTGGQRAVEKGLSEGQAIVTDGAFHLNNQRKGA